ncbi:protein of unknown function [Methanoculleus bourgensis]|uniref:Uncharacterized protein n=1 Tax=Methanoculleus bourgensis TaxID=83986 RepID=A0A0X3BNH0_9EURY|nr:protein of unknown function [Methanoculleus bourgensis]
MRLIQLACIATNPGVLGVTPC